MRWLQVLNTSTDPDRSRRVFLIGLIPPALRIPASVVANQIDSAFGGAAMLLAFAAESVWMLYLSSK
jgi:hypothetical protein